MKIIIKSTYDYGTHTEEMQEEIDGIITFFDDSTSIEYSNGYILIEDNKITQKRNKNVMAIENGKVTTCEYKTDAGIIKLKIEGIGVKHNPRDAKLCKALYFISANGAIPYKVKIEIIKS